MSIQRTCSFILVITVTALSLASCGGNDGGAAKSAKSSSGAQAAGCTPGVQKVKGVDATVHCGPATASFTIDGTTTTASGGSCISQGGAWILNAGATVVDTSASDEQRGAVEYVGIIAGNLDPSKTDDRTKVDPAQVDVADVLVTFTGGGHTDSMPPGKSNFTITGDGPTGTFEGPTVKGSSVSGTFDCSS